MLTVAVINRFRRNRRVFFVTIETKKMAKGWRDNYRRVCFLGEAVETILQTLILPSTVFVCLEAGSFGSRGRAVHILAEIGQEITHRMMSVLNPTHVTKAAPLAWKAAIMHDVPGPRGKEEIIEYLAKREKILRGLKEIKAHHNLFDAYGMAWVMEHVLTVGPDNNSQKRILEGLNAG